MALQSWLEKRRKQRVPLFVWGGRGVSRSGGVHRALAHSHANARDGTAGLVNWKIEMNLP